MDKRYLYVCIVALAAILPLTSCSKKLQPKTMRMLASAEGLATKASLDLNGGAAWRPFESISVFGSNPSCARFTYSGSSLSKTAYFDGAVAVEDGVAVLGLSPYDVKASRKDDALLLDLPSVQEVPGGAVNELLFRQAASAVGQTMAFHQVFSGICFSLDASNVKYLTIEGNAGETLAGGLSVSFDAGIPVCTVVRGEKSVVVKPASGNTFQAGLSYAVALAPQVLKSGITVVLQTLSGSRTVRLDRELDLARGRLCRIDRMDADGGGAQKAGITEMVEKGQPFELEAEFIGHVMEVDDCYVAQGAASDGKNAYFVLRNSSDNGAVILKYSLSPFKVLDCSERFDGGHCNDLTYNDKTGKVILAHGQTQGKILTMIDAQTLRVEGNVDITVGSGAITYNASRDRYAISQGGTTLHFADGSLKALSSHTRTDKIGYTAQGMGSDDKFIYFPMSGSGDNKLVVYDWDARYIMTLTVPLAMESESMFSVNGEHYVCFYCGGSKKGADLYRILPK